MRRVITQRVEYDWCPTKCGKCHKLGHSGEACRNKQGKEAGSKSKTMVWRPKKNTEDRDKEIAQPTEREAGILKEYSIIQKATPRYEEEFQTVDKKKSAKRGIVYEEQFVGGINNIFHDALYEGHYPFLA
ncbi:unnamed protein product [Cuscuta campestris]|uniref:Uncharacterized protein n=1 Tax=Cuscuta campestris TaxID=132261 RepID=A0A484MLI6_9ASTE|nr:unnamed protein product [Cuscuta campestris]